MFVSMRPPKEVAKNRPDRRFSCPFRFEGELFDCLLLLEETGPIRPGQRVVVPIKFLRPDVIKDMLSRGQRFQLWNMRPFAEGHIIEVCADAEGQVGNPTFENLKRT
jgi:hypothetical protein